MLLGKNIVITGANRGIGLAITKACAQSGANIWACMRSEPGQELLDCFHKLEIDHQIWIHVVELDVSREESIQNAKDSILQDRIPISGIVNNAGITGEKKLFSMTSMQEIKDVFETNFFGPMLFTQKLIKNMMKYRQGSIVNISSVAALDGEPAQFGYVSSKAALIGATKKLASELGQFGIRVNAVAPGMTDTEMVQKMSEELREKTLDRTVLHRLARPEEIAKTVVYLLSDNSNFITGQILRVDGGGF